MISLISIPKTQKLLKKIILNHRSYNNVRFKSLLINTAKCLNHVHVIYVYKKGDMMSIQDVHVFT